MPNYPQDILIKKVSEWQSRFIGNTHSFNEQIKNEGLCLGLSIWNIYASLAGKKEEFDAILKRITASAPLDGDLSPEDHLAFETFANNTLWLQRELQTESRTEQFQMEGVLEALFKKSNEPFPLTYHHHLAGMLSEEELKGLIEFYLNTNHELQQDVGFTVGCNGHAISITRIGNRIEVIDPSESESELIELPSTTGDVEQDRKNLSLAVNDLWEKFIYTSLRMDQEKYKSTYRGVFMHVYSSLRGSSPQAVVYPSPAEILSPIYEQRKETLTDKVQSTKLSALDFAVKNGDHQLVEYLENVLGSEGVERLKQSACQQAVLSGHLTYVKRYYKPEYVTQQTLYNAFMHGNKEVIDFLLAKGHRFEKEPFERAVSTAVIRDQGHTFNDLMHYYQQYHEQDADFISPYDSSFPTKSDTNLLNLATQNSSIEVTRLLLEGGVDLRATDAQGRNCLHYLSLHQQGLLTDIINRDPSLLLVKDNEGLCSFHRFFKESAQICAPILPILIENKFWYEAYLLALRHDNIEIIKQCRENISVAELIAREGNVRESRNSFIEFIGSDSFGAIPLEQVVYGLDFSQQTQDTLQELYLLALTHSNTTILDQIQNIDSNRFFQEGPISTIYPWSLLQSKPALFDLIATKIKVHELSQESLVEYYLLALHHQKQNLCLAISELINDKDSLFLKSTLSKKDPFPKLEQQPELFSLLIKTIQLNTLSTEARNQLYKLSLSQNNHPTYEACLEQIKNDDEFKHRTDDLEWCYQHGNIELFTRLFQQKEVSKEWCTEFFIKKLDSKQYHFAKVILTKMPQIVNEEIGLVNGRKQFPLWMAINQNNISSARFLLANGANPRTKRLSQELIVYACDGTHPKEMASVFINHEKNIAQINSSMSQIISELVKQKWTLKKKFLIGGPYVDSISRVIKGATVHFPKSLEGILDAINTVVTTRTHTQQVQIKLNELHQKILQAPLPKDLQDKLLQILDKQMELTQHSIPTSYENLYSALTQAKVEHTKLVDNKTHDDPIPKKLTQVIDILNLNDPKGLKEAQDIIEEIKNMLEQCSNDESSHFFKLKHMIPNYSNILEELVSIVSASEVDRPTASLSHGGIA